MTNESFDRLVLSARGTPMSDAQWEKEKERRQSGAERLKQAYSSHPWYAAQAAKDPDYWNRFYASRVNW